MAAKAEPSPEEDPLSDILSRLEELENSTSMGDYSGGGDTFIDQGEEFNYFLNYITHYWDFYFYTVPVFGDLGIEVNAPWIRVDTPSDKSYGLDFDKTTADAQLRVAAGDGIKLVASYGVTVDLATDPGLEFEGTTPDGELKAKVNSDSGLEIDGDGIGINNGCGLTFEDGALVLDYAPNAGLTCGGTGLKIDARYGLQVTPVTDTNGKLDIMTTTPDLSVTPAGSGNAYPHGPGHGIYFEDGGDGTWFRMLLAPGDWLYIVP